MLVTTCAHCGARFRVEPGQLNARQGQVRCGECLQVFNGFESLAGYREDEASGPAVEAAESVSPDGKPEDKAVAPIAAPVHPTPADAAFPAPASLVAGTLASVAEVSEPPGAHKTASAPQAEVQPRNPAPIEQPAIAPVTRPARAWSFGVVLLGLALGFQVTYAYRTEIARRYPPLRTVLESACGPVGCSVPWPSDESALKLEESGMVEIPGRGGQVALQARIRNLSASMQQFPHLELTLTDASGQAAIRRVLRPADYLGGAARGDAALGPGAEMSLSLRLDTGSTKPTGYELLLFHP